MYPKILFTNKNISLFQDQLAGSGVEINLSDSSDIFEKCDIADQQSFQAYADTLMKEHDTNWAISSFGEYRETMFRALDARQMVEQKRFYHLGVDVWLPEGYAIYTPLDGVVVESGYEGGHGNYGGYAVVEYQIGNKELYVLYGHLHPESLLESGSKIQSGQQIATLGNMQENGGYFYHTHIQVLTKKGYESGFVSKGYADEQTFHEIGKYVLDPVYFLFNS